MFGDLGHNLKLCLISNPLKQDCLESIFTYGIKEIFLNKRLIFLINWQYKIYIDNLFGQNKNVFNSLH
ncbi:hypothetical protein BpHYR1_041257 [Brachionus plicatilis]|uniref:Uncharacterized protein n=1 Tax=Brachionus plicatilis TaxID=10195 RepID=A0A3M7PD11_BRAPC|nr:hypothetical protein BpHYR1_041257 [Brachionus plicatilis]